MVFLSYYFKKGGAIMSEREKYINEIKQTLFKIFSKFMNTIYELFAAKCDTYVKQYTLV